MEKKYKHGMILGKFLPFHYGHSYLIEEAAKQCEKVTVLVCSIKAEPINGYLRHYWVKTYFSNVPNVDVLHVMDENPQYPHENPNFWNIWKKTIQSNVKEKIDAVFTSENYGDRLAAELGACHVLVDLERKKVQISGTKIRTNPFLYWSYIPSIVRPYFMKKIVLVGPESVGKTYTSSYLANRFSTLWVPEYGREHTENKPKVEYSDISIIASRQMEIEQTIAMKASLKSHLLFCDTDLIVTQIWSEIFFKSCPEWIIQLNSQKKYDLYLLMKPDIPWINDGTRSFGHIREWHFEQLQQELKSRQLNFKVVSGNYTERLEMAYNFSKEIL